MRTLTITLLALGATSCTGSRDADPVDAGGASSEIVHCRSRVGDEYRGTEIEHATLQGLAPRTLVTRVGRELDVRVHADGVRIVFTRERDKDDPQSREIYVDSLDGSTPEQRLTANLAIDDGPCWSPDGEFILFSSDRAGQRHLWRMRADGSEVSQLTSGPGADRDPDWRNGIILCSRTGNVGGRDAARIQRLLPDGTDLGAITDGGTGLGDFEPALAPDGLSTLFSRAVSATARQLMIVDAAGTRPLDGIDADARQPRWSPAGDRIFFTRSLPRAGLAGLRLWAIAVDGSDPVLLFPDQRYACPGFDLRPGLPGYVPPAPAVAVDLRGAEIEIEAGARSAGDRAALYASDAVVFGIASVVFDGRDVAGLWLRVPLPVADPARVARIEVEIQAALSRTDGVLRATLYDPREKRFETVLEVTPPSTAQRTYAFTTASLAHVDQDGALRLQVIGSLTAGERAELLVDAVVVRFRLLP